MGPARHLGYYDGGKEDRRGDHARMVFDKKRILGRKRKQREAAQTESLGFTKGQH